MFTKKLRLLTSAVMLTALLALAGSSTAATTSERASGHGTLVNADGSKRQFSFNAVRHADGTVSGNAVLHNPAFQVDGRAYQLHMDITCMRVVGNIAIFGGMTRRTNDAGLVDAAFFTVQDNGEPGKGNDRISRVFFWDDDPSTTGNPQACLVTAPNAFPLETIVSGNIQVQPTGL